MTEPNEDVCADFYFAIIPEWVLALPISANAIRVYCVLRRFADNKTGECYPSRKTVAMRSRLSVSTLDRALKELHDHGAIEISVRRSEAGDYTSNLYTVRSFPKGVSSRAKIPPVMRGDTGVVTGGEQTKAIRSISKNSQRKDPIQAQWESIGAAIAITNSRTLEELIDDYQDHKYLDLIVNAFIEQSDRMKGKS
jgi:hypothetical protein